MRRGEGFIWLWGNYVNPNTGRRGAALLGPYKDTIEAMGDFQRFDGRPEIVELPTSDPSRASQLMKYREIHDSGQSVGEALQRHRHRFNGYSPHDQHKERRKRERFGQDFDRPKHSGFGNKRA